MRSRVSGIVLAIALSGSVAVITACDDTSNVPSAPINLGAPVAARVSGGPSVTGTNPSYGHRGESNKPVTVTGSGFSTGATVEWARGGIVDPNITVISATVVSSTQISAVITIAADADLSLYDVIVTNADRKKGVGTEMFEVTTATSIGSLGGNTVAYAAGDSPTGPRVVGYSVVSNVQHAFYWPTASGGMGDLGVGEAEGIDQLGATITGNSGGNPGIAYIWTSNGAAWTRSLLPASSQATGSHAAALVSDGSGAASIIAGHETFKAAKGNGNLGQPRLWKYVGGVWTRIALQNPSTDPSAYASATGANAAGMAVGFLRIGGGASQPVFWDMNGSYQILPGPAGSGPSGGINAAGTLVAGNNGSIAVYWTAVVNANGTRTWSGPFNLPGGCERAMGIDANDRIVGQRCPGSGGSYVSALWRPPYDAAGMTTLHGLGIKTDAGAAWAVSPGGLIAGTAPTSGSSNQVGVIWSAGIF